jgi:hypothetical protein
MLLRFSLLLGLNGSMAIGDPTAISRVGMLGPVRPYLGVLQYGTTPEERTNGVAQKMSNYKHSTY